MRTPLPARAGHRHAPWPRSLVLVSAENDERLRDLDAHAHQGDQGVEAAAGDKHSKVVRQAVACLADGTTLWPMALERRLCGGSH